VDRPHQLVRLGRDERAGFQGVAVTPSPLPQPGEGARPVILEADIKRLLPALLLLPLKKAVGGTDREFSSSFDRQRRATPSLSFPCFFPPDARKSVFFFCFVLPKGDACMELVPRFNRASYSDAEFTSADLVWLI
jgi:hypothetical protein